MNQQSLDDATNFLYPFIDGNETDASALLADLTESALAKAAVSAALRQSTLEACAHLVESAGAEMARRFAAGGRLFTFGNGGSSTDAATLASRAGLISGVSKRTGVRYCPRLHVELYGNTRGT